MRMPCLWGTTLEKDQRRLFPCAESGFKAQSNDLHSSIFGVPPLKDAQHKQNCQHQTIKGHTKLGYQVSRWSKKSPCAMGIWTLTCGLQYNMDGSTVLRQRNLCIEMITLSFHRSYLSAEQLETPDQIGNDLTDFHTTALNPFMLSLLFFVGMVQNLTQFANVVDKSRLILFDLLVCSLKNHLAAIDSYHYGKWSNLGYLPAKLTSPARMA